MPFKIHPGIGVARAGDSPTDWFVGPETAEEPVAPPGGYKDSECRVKRQAARFRIWQYDSGGAAIEEFTLAHGAITWSVKLGTAVTPVTTISGPNQQATLPGAPSFGELRTDPEGRSIVLSGLVAGAFDARCDGWIKADITPDGGALEPAAAAWMVVGPPDYAPSVPPVLNVYAKLQQFHIDNGMSIPVPSSPSFLREIYPLFRGGALSGVLDTTGFPFLADSAARAAKAAPYSPSASPLSPTWVTATQRAMLDSWVAGSFTDDWASLGTPLPLTPAELDRGPISHCLQLFGAYEFGSGIVALGTPYVEPYRLDVDAVTHGFSVAGLLDWRSDAHACVGEWPAQAMSPVLGPGNSPDFWHLRGFVVRDSTGGTDYVEECTGIVPYVMLETLTVNFGDVPQAAGGGTAYKSSAIVFEVGSLPSALTFTLGPSPTPSLTSPVSSFTVGPLVAGDMATRHVWLTYETGAIDSTIDVTVTVTQSDGPTHTVRVLARTVAPLTTKLGFVVDVSGSMNEDRGDGLSKLQGLKDAMDVAIDISRENDGIGLAPYNHDALPTLAITQLGPNVPLEPQRESVRNAVLALTAGGSTLIGDGIVSGRTVLASPPLPPTATFEREALIIVTDGKENSPLFIDDVAGAIDQRTFSIGIGTTGNINVSTLQRVSGNTGGYFLLTGAVSGDNQYQLQKYMLQILTEAMNDQIVLDPGGTVPPNGIERVPFFMSDLDRTIEAIVLTSHVRRISVSLETPGGELIQPTSLAGVPHAAYLEGAQAICYRFDLPFVGHVESAHGGRWSIRLAARDGRPVPYAAIVNTRSEIALRADVQQAGQLAGADVRVDAWLTQFGAPFPRSARVRAEWLRPSGDRTSLTLTEERPGHYVARQVLADVGLHRIRLGVDGRTEKGFAFTRETTRTLYAGVDDPSYRNRDTDRAADRDREQRMPKER